MKKFILCLMALALLLSTAALADMTIESTVVLDRGITLCSETNCYVARTDAGYQLCDAQGNILSAAYRSMTPHQNGLFLEVQNVSNTETLNCLGLLDASGQEILPLEYADFYYLSDEWVLAYVLTPTDSDVGEYKDASGNKFIVSRTDVVYKDRLIGSLSRDEYLKSYSTGTQGAYMYVKVSSSHVYWLDANFNRLDVTDESDGYVSTAEFYDFYKKGVLHNPTQQYAFTAGCTLTNDQVEQTVYYDNTNGTLLDLQGNVIASGLTYDYAYFRQNAMAVKQNGLWGIMTLDGREIAETKYDDVAYSDEGLFASGYNAVVDEKGRLSFLDVNGNVTASVEYELSSSDYKGFIYNAPIVAVNNMGKYIIITATHGELPTKYDDVNTVRGARQTIMAVQKDDVWGCIDMAGNTVIPFVHRSAPSISVDGTLVYAVTTDREYVLYRLRDTSAATGDNWTVAKQSGEDMDTTPVLADGAWECTCGTITNGNFCPECGAKKPEPTPAPAADGSWNCSCGAVNTGKFFPECGSARPAAEPQCASCGYKPEGDAPKFCPECGAKF